MALYSSYKPLVGAVASLFAGTDTAVSTATGIVTVWNTSTLQTVTDRGFTTTNRINVANTTSSTDPYTGSLTVAGGVGITGDLWIEGSINASVINGNATSSTNILGGDAGYIPIQISPGVTSFIVAGTQNQLLQSQGSTATFVNTSSLHVGYSSNIAGGTSGQLVYQVSSSTTDFVGPGAVGQLLASGGTGTPGFIDSGSSGQLLMSRGNGVNPVYQNTLTISENSVLVNGVGSSTSTMTGALVVSGGAGIAKSVFIGANATIQGSSAAASAVAGNALQVTTGGLGVASSGYFGGALRVASVTDSSSTSTGALQVFGGAGIGGNLYVKGIIDSINTEDANLTTPGASGSLRTDGGAGIAKNLAVGGTISRSGNLSQAAWQNATGVALNLASATYTDTSSGAGTLTGPSAATWFGQPTFASTNAVTYTNAATVYIQNAPAAGTNTTLSNSYALLVANGTVRIATTTNASSTTTGALQVAGGVGIGGSLYAGPIFSEGSQVITSASLGSFGISSITAGTDTVVSTSTGAVTIWNNSTLQTITNRGASTTNAINITNSTAATNTTTGALRVSGGIGALQVYATNLFDSGNRVLTSVTVNAGTGLSGGGTISGPSGSVTLTNTGVTSLAAGTGISLSTTTGAVTVTNTGVTSLTGTANQIAVSAASGAVTLSFPAGGITTTTGTFTSNVFVTATTNATSTSTGALQVAGGIGVARDIFVGGDVTIADATDSSSTSTGALVVAGGAGIARNLTVGANATIAGRLTRSGNVTATGWGTAGAGLVLSTATYTDSSLTGVQAFAAVHSIGRPTIAASSTPTYTDAATLYIDNSPLAGTNATIANPWSLFVANGNVKINTATVSNSASAGALVVTGGVGIGGNLNVGGAGSFAATGVTIGNTQIGSYTSGNITTNATQNLDTFSTSTYRSVKYTVQVVDGTKVHVTEMMVYHDNTTVYIMEYGISTNTGELGTFDATLAAGTITLTFTPNYTPAAMVIKANRSAIQT